MCAVIRTPSPSYSGYNARQDPGTVESVPFQSLSLNPAEQAAPLPVKVEYTLSNDPAPPPYIPSVSMYTQPPPPVPTGLHEGLYQQSLTTQPMSYQQPASMVSIVCTCIHIMLFFVFVMYTDC